MPSEKISEMPPAAFVLDVDLLPIVQAGVNLRCTKESFLSGSIGSNLVLRQSGGSRLVILASTMVKCFEIGTLGTVTVTSGGNGINIEYLATTASDWTGSPPAKVGDALDRCAALLKALNGGVGP